MNKLIIKKLLGQLRRHLITIEFAFGMNEMTQ